MSVITGYFELFEWPSIDHRAKVFVNTIDNRASQANKQVPLTFPFKAVDIFGLDITNGW